MSRARPLNIYHRPDIKKLDLTPKSFPKVFLDKCFVLHYSKQNMETKSFGDRVRELRSNHPEHRSLREFARKIGLSAAYISRIENGKESPPSEGVVEKIAEALGADKYELLSAAGKVPNEFIETFSHNPRSVASFMRRARVLGPESEKEWKSLEKTLTRLKGKSRHGR